MYMCRCCQDNNCNRGCQSDYDCNSAKKTRISNRFAVCLLSFIICLLSHWFSLFLIWVFKVLIFKTKVIVKSIFCVHINLHKYICFHNKQRQKFEYFFFNSNIHKFKRKHFFTYWANKLKIFFHLIKYVH